MMWAAFAILLGGAVGRRYKVLALLPIAPVIGLVALIMEISAGHGVFIATLAAIGTVGCLQFGYALGLITGQKNANLLGGQIRRIEFL